MPKKESNSKIYLSPYPSSAYVLRSLSTALGTKEYLNKAVTKKLDGYVRDGYYQVEKHNELLQSSILEPLNEFLKDIEIYNKSSKKKIEDNFNNFFDEYHKLVTGYSAAGLTANETAGILTFFFGHFGYNALVDTYKQIFNLESTNPELKNTTVISSVFEWINEKIPNFTTQSKSQHNYNLENESRWKNGKQVPSLSSLKVIIEILLSIPDLPKELILNFALALIYARAHDYFLISKRNILLKDVSTLYKSNPEMFPVGQRIIQMRLEKLVLHSGPLSIAVDISKELETDHSERMLSIEELSQRIELFKKTVKKSDHNHTLSYLYPWMKGKLSILCGDTKTSLACYKKAFEFSLYLGGEFQEQIIKEATVIAARHNNRVFLNKLKNQGIALGLYNYVKCEQPDPLIGNKKSRTKNTIVEDWEIKIWRDEFYTIFPANKCFPCAEKLLEDKIPTHILVDAMKHAKPDLRHPDRVIQISVGKPKYMPQLVYYSALNETHNVRNLLEHGANILNLTPEGESTLLFAIQKMNCTLPTFIEGREELFKTVYDYLKSAIRVPEFKIRLKEMVSTPTVKRKLTPLSCAAETGRPDIVNKVLKLGATADQRSGIDQITPLYTCLGLINSITSRSRFQENFDFYERNIPRHILEDTYRRYCGESLPEDMKIRFEHFEPIQNMFLNNIFNYNYQHLVDITKVLLEKEADPNSRNSTGLMHDYTPLMLSIETDNVDLFDMLIEYGGDTKLTYLSMIDGRRYTCKDIALKYNSQNILKIMN